MKTVELCCVKDCSTIARIKGYCQKHYAIFANPRKCSVDGCDLGKVAKGYCANHYQQLVRKHNLKKCSVEGCDKPFIARGLCTHHYHVAEKTGQIQNKQTRVTIPVDVRFKNSFRINDFVGCWNWIAQLDQDGYGAFWTGEKKVTAHRYSYEKVKGPVPEGLVLMHRCDNRRCINPDHLIPGTPEENALDMRLKGRNNIGSSIGTSKLDEEEVLQIKEFLREGKTGVEIAKLYDVSVSLISSIKNGIVWSHLDEKIKKNPVKF